MVDECEVDFCSFECCQKVGFWDWRSSVCALRHDLVDHKLFMDFIFLKDCVCPVLGETGWTLQPISLLLRHHGRAFLAKPQRTEIN